MSEIEFTKEEKEVLVNKIKSYFGENLEQEIGQFDAEFLLSFFVTTHPYRHQFPLQAPFELQ